MSTHTPGPWHIDRFGKTDKWAIGPDVAHRVCDTYGIGNACLIAAAPDLLEFAREVRRSGDTRLASMAIAVIARATPDN